MPISGSKPPLPSKPCAACGRSFTWRKKWERDWENVKYCSDRCRRAGAPAADDPFEAAILTLLSERAGGASICPSEAARRVGGDEWRGKMAHVRAAGARLASQGRVEYTQGGGVVQPERARGPVRIRLRRGGPNP